MYHIIIKGHFSSAHNLRGYKGKCEELHGHNWKVDITLAGTRLDKTGLLVDFREAKQWMNSVLDRLDHGYLNEKTPFDKINPTSENIARYIHDEMRRQAAAYKKTKVSVQRVRVWENDNAGAVYEGR